MHNSIRLHNFYLILVVESDKLYTLNIFFYNQWVRHMNTHTNTK